MSNQNIELSELIRHISEMPSDYRFNVLIEYKPAEDSIYLPAIIGDTMLRLGLGFPSEKEIETIFEKQRSANAWKLTAYLCYALLFSGFRNQSINRSVFLDLIGGQLDALARLVKADSMIDETERREEFARTILARLEILPAGESQKQAKDRLLMLDSIERQKVIEKTKQAQIRAQKLKEEMERQRAREAASKMSYE